MQTTRTNNISLFVTVLSACLLAVGAPTQVYAQPTQSVDLSSATAESRESGARVRREVKHSNGQSASHGAIGEIASQRRTSHQVFTENTKAIIERNSVLVVTRLARAALEYPLAEQPAAN